MGGLGSGATGHWNTATTLEEVPRIDIRYLRKRGWLVDEPGQTQGTILSWSCGGQDRSSIWAEIVHDRMQLGGDPFSDDHGETETIHFDESACHFGGYRKWFLCPDCGNRFAVLCRLRGRFLCRNCNRLPYMSQRQGDLDRLIRQKHKLGPRLFDDYDGFYGRRKKGMHQTTFKRMQERFDALEEQIDCMVAYRFGMRF